jgi:hypothetical protein
LLQLVVVAQQVVTAQVAVVAVLVDSAQEM